MDGPGQKQDEMHRGRPKLIWLIAVILVFNALVLACIAFWGCKRLLGESSASSAAETVADSAAETVVFLLILVLGASSALGLLSMTSRARSRAMMTSLLSIGAWGVLLGASMNMDLKNPHGEVSIPGAILRFCVILFSLIVGFPSVGYVFWYLIRPDVKRRFSADK